MMSIAEPLFPLGRQTGDGLPTKPTRLRDLVNDHQCILVRWLTKSSHPIERHQQSKRYHTTMQRYIVLSGLVLFLFVAVGVSSQGSPDPTIPSTDRAVLLALYQSTNGDHWRNREGWMGPVGTECHWFGVVCDYGPDGAAKVEGLFLEENNLSGTLPLDIDKLTHLDELLISGNQLSGRVPPLLLKRFDEGRIRFLGYAGQFSPIIEVDLSVSPSAVICGDYEIRLKVGGPDTLARKFCRNASADDRATFWERSSGRTGVYAGDIDRVARLIETSGLEQMASQYSRNITHGTYETITITYRDGRRKSFEDYAESAPAPIWLIKRTVAGAAFNGEWEQTTRSKAVAE